MLKNLNKEILYTTLILVFFGSLIFFSAALSSLKDIDFFMSIFLKQILAIFVGLIGMFILIKINFIKSSNIRKYSAHILLISIFIQLLVLVPGLGVTLKGARRWIDIGLFNVQPSELFKYSFIIFLAAVFATKGKKLKNFKWFFLISLLSFAPLTYFFYQIRDFGTLVAILFASFCILLISESKKSFIFLSVILLLGIGLPLLYTFVPYVNERLSVYINPETANVQDEYWQMNNMLTTIGSGEIVGRGFGSSLQKFSGTLPEPLGDSIFAVYSEEFGFMGSILLIFAFLLLLFFILKAAQQKKNNFERMVIVGLGVLVVFPAFYNIGASTGVVPLSGMPMTFVSKGGTSIFSALLAMGLILSMTKRR